MKTLFVTTLTGVFEESFLCLLLSPLLAYIYKWLVLNITNSEISLLRAWLICVFGGLVSIWGQGVISFCVIALWWQKPTDFGVNAIIGSYKVWAVFLVNILWALAVWTFLTIKKVCLPFKKTILFYRSLSVAGAWVGCGILLDVVGRQYGVYQILNKR